MLLKQKIVDALNQQVGEELAAWSQYTAIALYFDRETLPQLAAHFYAQADEEHMHAMKILHYLTDADAHALVPTVPEPQNEFDSAQACVELSLQQELKVTDEINKLVDLASSENDHLTREFLQWFVTEQLEEVASMTDLLNVVKRAGETNLLLVEEYLARNPAPVTSAPADGAA